MKTILALLATGAIILLSGCTIEIQGMCGKIPNCPGYWDMTCNNGGGPVCTDGNTIRTGMYMAIFNGQPSEIRESKPCLPPK